MYMLPYIPHVHVTVYTTRTCYRIHHMYMLPYIHVHVIVYTCTCYRIYYMYMPQHFKVLWLLYVSPGCYCGIGFEASRCWTVTARHFKFTNTPASHINLTDWLSIAPSADSNIQPSGGNGSYILAVTLLLYETHLCSHNGIYAINSNAFDRFCPSIADSLQY